MQSPDPMPVSDPMTAPNPHLPARPEWLALRREDIIEPELPIVDPHHHLVDRANTGRYLLPELLDDIDTGHNIVATVYLEWLSMYRQDGPPEMRPVGEIEFANGVAAMAASGLRQNAGLRRHCRPCRSDARGTGRAGAGSDDCGGRRPVPRHPLYQRVAPGRGGARLLGQPAGRAC